MFDTWSLPLAVGPNGRHLAGDILEVYFGSAAFFVLLALFLWKGLPPLRKALANRTESIRTELEEARNGRMAAEEALSAGSDNLPDLGQERSRIRKEAIEQAEKVKADLIAKAHSDAEALVEKGKADCTNMRRQALADVQAEVAQLTKETTEAVVRNDIEASTQGDLIDSYIDKVGQLT